MHRLCRKVRICMSSEMNKETAIRKINQIGKAGYVISIIAQVFVIIAIVGTVAAGVIMLWFPKDAVVLTAKGDLGVNLQLDKLGDLRPTEEQLKNFQDHLNGHIYLNGRSYQIDDIDIAMENEDTGAVRVATSTPEVSIDVKDLGLPILPALLYLAMTMVSLLFIRALCKAFKICESPFDEEVIRRLKRLAYSLIPWVFMAGIADSISESMFSGNTRISLNVDLGMLMVVAIVLALSYVFQYGAVLQRESDETL